jgi:hypothetical protein
MDKNKRILLLVVSAALVTVLALAAVLPRQSSAAQWLNAMRRQPVKPASVLAASLNGVYFGQVELDYAAPGEYGDSLPTPDPNAEPPPDLGSIDLGLQLTQIESGIEGYVDLEHTLVFTTEHTVGATAFGPMVTGSFDGTNLSLESERVSLVSADQRLMRQFQMIGQVAEDNEHQIIGEYRETVWGYGSQPLTIVGSFTLDWTSPAMTDFIFLPLISVK